MEFLKRFIRPDSKLFVFLLIAIAGAAVYIHAINAPFYLDDNELIINNLLIQDSDYLLHPSHGEDIKNYGLFRRRFVGFLTFALNFLFHGHEPAGYRVVNIALHILNAFLIYLFVRTLCATPRLSQSSFADKAPLAALITALVFVIHPVHTQAVTYIYQRMTVLVATFYIGGLLMYAQYRFHAIEKNKGAALFTYLAALVLICLAVTTKETAVTFPFVLVVFELTFFEGKVKLRLLSLAGFIVPMLLFLYNYLQSDILGSSGDIALTEYSLDLDLALPLYDRVHYYGTQLWVLTLYMKALFFPSNLHFMYKYELFSFLLDPALLFAGLVHAALLFIALNGIVRTRRGNAIYTVTTFGIFWFYLTLLVETVATLPSMANMYRAYLPGVGLLFAAVMLVIRGLSAMVKEKRGLFIAVAGMLLLALSSLTLFYNHLWNDKVSLWSKVVEESPNNELAHLNLAQAYLEKNQTDNAQTHLLAAVKINPGYADAQYFLGKFFHDQGKLHEAVQRYETAVYLKGGYVEAYWQLAFALYELGDFDRSRETYERLIKIKPDFPEAYHNLGRLYEKQGRLDEAIEQYTKAVSLNPDYTLALLHLGNAYFFQNDLSLAEQSYKRVISQDPVAIEALNNLAYVYYKQGMFEKAVSHYERALEEDPSFAEAWKGLSETYLALGKFSEAGKALERAERLDPEDVELERLRTALKRGTHDR